MNYFQNLDADFFKRSLVPVQPSKITQTILKGAYVSSFWMLVDLHIFQKNTN